MPPGSVSDTATAADPDLTYRAIVRRIKAFLSFHATAP
jgi:hypothetical protein